MKDHEFREAVNSLKRLVDVYSSTGQLRERLSVFLRGFEQKVKENNDA